ncbi:MAG: VWA domain-containing protein [Clostridia bacterium]|nr:VWA domain-containing protein [Clostridia bacterium]
MASSDDIAKYVRDSVESDEKNKIGIIAFGAGKPYVFKKLQTKPKFRIEEIWSLYDNPRIDDEGFIMTTGTDIASAIKFSATQFTNYSNSSLEKPLSNCRLIILTDGIETDGNATTAASEVASMGLTIDAVYFAPRDYADVNEVQIENVEILNRTPVLNQSVQVDITIKSHTYRNGTTATFNIYDLNNSNPNVPIKTLTEDINSPEKTVTTSVQFETSGVHALKVEIEPLYEDENSFKQNNVFYSYVVVQARSCKILIIKGFGVDATEIKTLIDQNVIGANGCEINEVRQSQAPTDLSKYSEVILVNVNSSNLSNSARLPSNYDIVLNNYVANGGSVLTIGGEETYYNGNMAQDKFNDFLPINVKPKKNNNKAIVLLIDRTSAMVDGAGSQDFRNLYSKTRLQVIQEAVTEVLADGTFNKDDYIGLIFFGGKDNTPIEALQLTAASNVLGISRAINMDITSLTSGSNYLISTEYRHALEAATKMLQSFQVAENKHILLISDGAPGSLDAESSNISNYPNGGWKYYGAKLPAGFTAPEGIPEKCYTDFIYDTYGITTSTIAISPEPAIAEQYLDKMANSAKQLDNKDHSHVANTPEEIAEAISVECKNIPRNINGDVLKDLHLRLQGNELTSIARDEDLPNLNGYNEVSVKQGATVLIETGDGNPIYAEWSYGKGRVGALMTDLSSDWGEALIAEDETEGRAIIKYLLLKNIASNFSALTTDMSVVFSQRNFMTSITIKDIYNQNIFPTDSGEGMGFIESYYHYPSDKLDPTNYNKPNGSPMSPEEYINYLCPFDAPAYKYDSMTLVAGEFKSEFKTTESGVYTVAFLRLNSNQEILDSTPPYTFVVFSYSDEYDTFYDAELSRSILSNICQQSGGTFSEYQKN